MKPTTRYLNWQGETIDELCDSDFEHFSEFWKEQKRLRLEYEMAGMFGAYWSQRPYKGWRD